MVPFPLKNMFLIKKGNNQHKNNIFNGNSTMRTASSRTCDLPKFHQIPAYVALLREKSLIFIKNLHFRRSTDELRPRERSHEFRTGLLISTIPRMSSVALVTAEL